MINSCAKKRVKQHFQALILNLLVLINLPAYGQEPPASDESVEPAVTKAASFYSGDDIQLLAERLPSNQVTWLNVDQKPVLALFNAEKSGKALGGVIVIPSHEQPLGTFTLLNNLQQTLINNRWHALSVSMPTVEDNALRTAFFNTTPANVPEPVTEDTSTATTEPADTVPTQPPPPIDDDIANKPDVELIAQQTIEAAVRFFNDKGVYNMVILGEGSGGVRALQYLSKLEGKQQLKQIRGIALLNSYNQVDQQHPDINTLITKIKHPILDLYFTSNDRYQRDARLRQAASRALPPGQYQSVKLPYFTPVRQREEDRLSKRIRGWLDKTAAGVSVEKR